MHTKRSTADKPATAVALAVSGSHGISLPAVPLLQSEKVSGNNQGTVQRLKIKLPPPNANNMEGEMVSYDSEDPNSFLLLQQWVETAAVHHKLLLILLGGTLQKKGFDSLTPNEKILYNRIHELGMIVEESEMGEDVMDEEKQVPLITPQQLAGNLQTSVPYWTNAKWPKNIKIAGGVGKGPVCSELAEAGMNAFAEMKHEPCWCYGVGFGEDEHTALIIVPFEDIELEFGSLPPGSWIYDPWLRISCAASEYDGKIAEVKTQWQQANYQIKNTSNKWITAQKWFDNLGGKSVLKLTDD